MVCIWLIPFRECADLARRAVVAVAPLVELHLAPVRARLVYVLRVRDVARLTDGGRGVRVSCLGRMPLPILLSSPRFLCILGSVAAKSAVNFVK